MFDSTSLGATPNFAAPSLSVELPPAAIDDAAHSLVGFKYPEPKVLLIDDDADNLALLACILERFPCVVFCETDGAAALKRSQDIRFDLVMLDIQMPCLSGLEVLHTLRSNSLNASVPVVAVTALAREQDQRDILAAGCDRYISKPYMLADVEALISQYITPA